MVPQYTPEVPNVPNNESSPDGGGSRGDSTNGGGGGETDGAGASGKDDGSGSGGGVNTGQGSQGGAQNGAGDKADGGTAGGKLADSKPISSFGEPAGAAADDGSSSPLVPILIAIAILAAISIGAFYYRQRRQDTDSPVSPKAS